jgi:Glycosyltransferase sugar-binding region containing DXD motif
MERLAIQSFLDNGHAYHLYCYGDVEGVPTRTIVQDGADILPAAEVFGYADGFAKGSVAAFSNFFRYKLLVERGGWWVDTDVVCLRPFDLTDERLWASERVDPPGELVVSTSVIKVKPGDSLMAWAWNRCSRLHRGSIRFGQIGPRLLQAGVDALNLHAFIRPHTFFSPIAFYDWRTIVDGSRLASIPAETYGVHLWNQMWAANGVDKDSKFPEGCLYETLKRRFPWR